MELSPAINAFGALAQKSRLQIFRLLMQCGPEGMAAGDIARTLRIPHNTLSFHVAVLSRAKLVAPRKDGRSIIYAVDLKGTRELLAFLVEDCCNGKPEICEALLPSPADAFCPV
jgi:ArsR family transcriptional regulator, arsenate/arsenite/antimonite-responsive transcriptional repressor